MVRLLSWNVRGLNDHEKRVLLKNAFREWNCDLICLQETKLEKVELSDKRNIWGIQHVGFSMLKATGSVGGVIVLWNTNSFQSSSCGDFSITCFLQSVERSFFWAFTGIYGPHSLINF